MRRFRIIKTDPRVCEYSLFTSPLLFLSTSQLYSKRTWGVDSAAGLHPAAAGEQGALGGPEETAAPSGTAAPRAGGVQAPTAGRAPETHRAAEGAKEASGGGEGREARLSMGQFSKLRSSLLSVGFTACDHVWKTLFRSESVGTARPISFCFSLHPEDVWA